MGETTRVVMLDPDWFGDVDAEREAFNNLLDDVVVDSVNCEADEIDDAVGKADILLTHYTGVSADAMDATDCQVVARYATGVDGIDIEAATERNIRVTRVPSYCDNEVGVHIISLAMALLRSLPQYDAYTQEGSWAWQDCEPLHMPNNSTFGFLAFGNKAQSAAEKAQALNFEVQAFDPYLDDTQIEGLDATPVDLETLLATSDILSINTPLTEDTREIIDSENLNKMNDDAILINASRGKTVDEEALVNALDSDELRGAGLDVLASEPPTEENPLLGRDDTIVTPHAAWYSEESAATLRQQGSKNAAAALQDENIDAVVNPGSLK